MLSPNVISPYTSRRRGKEALFSSARILNSAKDTVIVRFSQDITSPGTDYAAGVTIEKNDVSQTISSATLQGDGQTVHYVLDEDATANDMLTWAYDSGPGDLKTVSTNVDVVTIASKTVVNEIAPLLAGALQFNVARNSGHLWNAGF